MPSASNRSRASRTGVRETPTSVAIRPSDSRSLSANRRLRMLIRTWPYTRSAAEEWFAVASMMYLSSWEQRHQSTSTAAGGRSPPGSSATTTDTPTTPPPWSAPGLAPAPPTPNAPPPDLATSSTASLENLLSCHTPTRNSSATQWHTDAMQAPTAASTAAPTVFVPTVAGLQKATVQAFDWDNHLLRPSWLFRERVSSDFGARDSGEVAIMADPNYRFGSAAKTLTNTIAMVLDNAFGNRYYMRRPTGHVRWKSFVVKTRPERRQAI